MLRGNGHSVYPHLGDVPDYLSSNADSHDELSSSSDDLGVITLPSFAISHIFLGFFSFMISIAFVILY
jgi:hypothetical protein